MAEPAAQPGLRAKAASPSPPAATASRRPARSATKQSFPMVAADFPIAVGREPVAVALGDLNGDGATDIITASSYGPGGKSDVSVLLADP
ncbi:MAG: VCBS repeat-containing protein [Deltaproteobacteria bacterium]|nr:VCBS repeat-containing protein [Deltaproteobacteria bacterium]